MTPVKFKAVPNNFVLDNFFNSAFNDFFTPAQNHNRAAVNIHESDDNFNIEVAAPGFQKENFEIKIEEKSLKLVAKRTETKEESKVDWKHREFSYNSFERSFTLPDTVDVEGINAAYTNGILSLTLPKRPESKPVTKTVKIA